MDPPWRGPLKVEIAESKEKATLLHAGDSNALSVQIYTDGSDQNGRISAWCHHSASLVLGTAGDAQAFHRELAGIDFALHLIRSRYIGATRCHRNHLLR